MSRRTLNSSASPVDRKRLAESERFDKPTAWRASDMHLLQRLYQESTGLKRGANSAAIDGNQAAAQGIAHWRYMLTDLLRMLARSHPFGQLTPKQRAMIHRAAEKRGWEIPPPDPNGHPSIGPLPKRPPGR